MTSRAALCYLGIASSERRFWGSDRPTTQNRYFVEGEHHHAAAPAGQWQVVSAAVHWGATPVISLRASERNKITQVLLRWAGFAVNSSPVTMRCSSIVSSRCAVKSRGEALAFLRLKNSPEKFPENELTKAELFTDGIFLEKSAPGRLSEGNYSLPRGQTDPRNAAPRPELERIEKAAWSKTKRLLEPDCGKQPRRVKC